MPQDPRVVGPLSALKNHWSGKVRYAVAFGLQGYEDNEAIQALIELSTDEYDDVRDWATTGLAGIGRDTAEIRDALARRLNDPDEITAREAACGLARRGDARAVEPLLRALRKDDVDSDIVEAAEAMGDRRVQLALRVMRARTVNTVS